MEHIEIESIENNGSMQESSPKIEKEIIKEKFTWQVALMLIIIILAWSTPNVIGRYLQLNSDITPIQIGALRYIPAGLTLVIFCLITKRGKQLIIDLKEKYLHLIIASLILTSFVLFQMFSVKLTEASASSFLLNVNPVITFILSIIILKERHKWWGGLGVLISAIGIFFIAVPLDEIGNLLSSDALLGNILAFFSGVAWAVYSIYLKKYLGDRDPITTTTWNLSISAILLIVSALVEMLVLISIGNWIETPPTYYHIITILFMGVVPTAIAFTFWFAVIQRIHVQKASVFQFLIPVFATLFALALGETIDLFFGIGGGLILIGLILTQFS